MRGEKGGEVESKSLEDRVSVLENEMEGLRGLPDRVASLEVNILQFRTDVRGEFSALRQEIQRMAETLRGEMRLDMQGTAQTLRGEMQGMAQTLRGDMQGMAQTLRAELRAGDAETRRYMRVLHEEVLSRIANISRR